DPLVRQRASAGDTGEQVRPVLRGSAAEGGRRADTGDDDALGHSCPSQEGGGTKEDATPRGARGWHPRDHSWPATMKLTASATVLRFLTSSSGMVTPNFSSALTTIVIIEIESMSRSSVNDFSRATSDASMPVSSVMSSARPERTSSLVKAMWISSFLREIGRAHV